MQLQKAFTSTYKSTSAQTAQLTSFLEELLSDAVRRAVLTGLDGDREGRFVLQGQTNGNDIDFSLGTYAQMTTA